MNLWQMLAILHKHYPKQIADPRRTDVNSLDDVRKHILHYNGQKRMWLSLYNYSRNNTELGYLPFIWCDLDDNPYKDIIRAHNWCLKQNLRHLIIFSGHGFHLYIKSKETELQNAKVALENYHRFLQEKSDINIDPAVIGDTARVVGIPGTLNTKRNRFVVFVNQKMLDRGYMWISNYARYNKKTNKAKLGRIQIFPGDAVDLQQFDGERMYERKPFELDESNIPDINDDSEIALLPVCVKRMLKSLLKYEAGYDERYYCIKAMIKLGKSKKFIDSVMQKWLPPDEYISAIVDEEQLYYAWKNRMGRRIGCKNIQDGGWCDKKIEKKCGFRYML